MKLATHYNPSQCGAAVALTMVTFDIPPGVVEVVAVVGFPASKQVRTPRLTAARTDSVRDLHSLKSGGTCAFITTFGQRGSTETHHAPGPPGAAVCHRAEVADDAATVNRSLAGNGPPAAMSGSDGLPGGIEDYNEIPER